MSNQYLKLRRSAVPGKVPDTASLDFGEIALNTHDGLAFMKISSSAGQEVIAIGGGAGDISGSQYYAAIFSGSSAVVTGSIYDSGSFTAIGATTTPHLDAPERFFVDASDTESYNLISGHGTINNYLQLNIKNFSSAATASSDIVATADNGDESSFFIDMGVNSSGYNVPDGIGQSNDAYLYSTAQDLLIGNASAGKKVIIFNGSGPALDNARIFITSEGTVGVNASDTNISNPEALLVEPLATGNPAPTDFSNLIVGKGTINESYLQLNMINQGTGSYASTDIVASNNLGTETTNYIDMGINASTHIVDPSFAPGGANDSYLLSTANDLLIGSATSGEVILWTGPDFDDKANAKLILKPNDSHILTGSLEATQGFTGSLFGTASWAKNALTASFGGNFTASNALITGTITAQTLVVQTVTSSVVYSSGSNIFGNDLSNTQVFTGSVNITGSLTVNGYTAVTSDMTGSMSVATASYAETASYVVNAISASYVSGSAAIVTNLTSSNDALINGINVGKGNNSIATNTVVGINAGLNIAAATRTVLIGYEAGKNITTGTSYTGTVLIGHQAGFSMSTGYWNVAIGDQAGYNITSGNRNTLVGEGSGLRITTANRNTLIGNSAGINITTGDTNIVVGATSGQSITTGIGNIVLGISPNVANTGNYNVFIGSLNSAAFASISNNIILADGQGNIKYRWDATQNNIYGNLAVTGSVTATTGFTGSLFGTASWAQNSITASYALNVSGTVTNAISSSYPISVTGSTLYSVKPAAHVPDPAQSSDSIFFGNRAGFQTTNTSDSNFIGQYAGYTASNANSSNFIGAFAGYGATNANTSNFIGFSAGQNAREAYESVFIGPSAGNSAVSASDAVFIGSSAGGNSTNGTLSNFVGFNAGVDATNASSSNFIGVYAGQQSINAYESNFIGTYAGRIASTAYQSNFIGTNAGRSATNANNSNFFGTNAGFQATYAENSIFIGKQSGYRAQDAYYSNFLGLDAGYSASSAYNANFFGNQAGYFATDARKSNFFGESAGYLATNALRANFLGTYAGSEATNAEYSNFIGDYAGYQATNASYSTFIGTSAGESANSASYSVLIGYLAGWNADGGANGISSNNIIIGSRITLEAGRKNSINLGGLIFGTGSYFSTNGVAFSGSNNGRVGINQPNPSFSLDVSGSGRYTSGLTVTGSLIAPNITGSLFGTASWAQNSITASYAFTASSAISASQAQTASYVLNAISSSYAFTASSAVNSTNALTASSADNFVVRNSLTASNALITGTITAQTLVVQTVSSSVVYSSGSNVFGNSLTNTQVFTGSVSVTGSLSVNGSNVVLSNQTGSMSVLSASLAQTASYVLNAVSASYAFTASSAISSSFAATASFAINALTASFISTASLVGNFFVQGGNSFGTTAVLGTNDSQPLAFETNGSIRMFISGSGAYVGIGTTSPTYSLDVAGVGGNDGIVRSRRMIATGGTAADPPITVNSTIAGLFEPSYGNLGFSAYGGEAGRIETLSRYWNIGMTGGTAKFNIRGSGSSSATNALVVQNSTPTTLFVVRDDGNVGIGTTTPSYKLDVSGSIRMPNAGYLYINSVAGDPTQVLSMDTGDNVVLNTTASGDLYFRSGNNTIVRLLNNGEVNLGGLSATSSPLVKINTAGNVGIGTTSPTLAKLQVNGNVYANSVTGSLFGTASWAQNALTSSYVLNAISSSYAFTASSAVNSFTAISSSNAATASSADNFVVRQALTASNALINGTITAQTLVVSTVSSSVVYSSGSNVFGNSLTNTQVFTGSVSVTGSFTSTGSLSNQGSVTITNSTGTGSVGITSNASSTISLTGFYNTGQTNMIFTPGGSDYFIDTFGTGNRLIIRNNSGITLSAYSSATQYMHMASTGVRIGGNDQTISARLHVSGSDNSLFLVNSSTAGGVFYISGSGNIGIGTTSPSYKLHVSGGSAFINGSIYFGDSNHYLTTDNATYSMLSSNRNLQLARSGVAALTIASTGNTILQSGGTITDTGERLQVSGSSRFAGDMVITGSLTVIQGITGSLFGTASWARNAITSSYVLNAISSSYAFTASSAVSSSFSITSLTASYANSGFDIGIAEFQTTSSITVAGTTIVSSINTGSFTSCFYNYTIASGSNARSGQVMSVWNGTTVRYTEVTTMDIGNTATASFAVALSGPTVRLSFSAPGSWTVKNISNLL